MSKTIYFFRVIMFPRTKIRAETGFLKLQHVPTTFPFFGDT